MYNAIDPTSRKFLYNWKSIWQAVVDGNAGGLHTAIKNQAWNVSSLAGTKLETEARRISAKVESDKHNAASNLARIAKALS